MATRAGVAECSTSPMAQRSRARSIRASPVTGYCGCPPADLGVDLVAVADDGGDELAGQGGRVLVALLLGEVAFEDGVGRALAEVGLEDRRQGEPPTRPPAADAVSSRHRRPGR